MSLSPERKPSLHLRVLDLQHPGCQRFVALLGDDIVASASNAVLEHLYSRLPGSSPREVRSITVVIRSMGGLAHTCGIELDDAHTEIHLSANYIQGLSAERLKPEILGVLTHEMVHAWQHDGQGTLPGGLIEGIADWVRLEAGMAPPHWGAEPGKCWDAGYEKTAYFLRFVSKHLAEPLLVPKLNMAFRSRKWQGGQVFREVAGGKPVEELWEAYKRQYDDSSGANANANAGSEPARPTGAV